MSKYAVISSDAIKQKTKELGFHKVGITAVDGVDETAVQLVGISQSRNYCCRWGR